MMAMMAMIARRTVQHVRGKSIETSIVRCIQGFGGCFVEGGRYMTWKIVPYNVQT